MTNCWKQVPEERPGFKDLVKHLENLLLERVEYFEFDKVDESKDYYQEQESTESEEDCENELLETSF